VLAGKPLEAERGSSHLFVQIVFLKPKTICILAEVVSTAVLAKVAIAIRQDFVPAPIVASQAESV
jgi:hypothetical protein